MILLLLAAQSPLVDLGRPTNTAYYCQFKEAGLVRRLSLLVERKPDGSFEMKRTIDPSSILRGRDFTVFRSHAVPEAFSATTSLGSPLDPDPYLMTIHPPVQLGSVWLAEIGPLKRGSATSDLQGVCTVRQQTKSEQFEKMAVMLGDKK